MSALVVPASSKKSSPAEEILAKVGDLSNVDVFLNEVLVGVFERDTIGTSGKLFVSDITKQNDQHMGKAAMILKLGPGVDVDDNVVQFQGRKLKVGDWVAVMPADGWPVKIRDQRCRLIPDNRIKLRIPAPEIVY